MTRIMDWWPSYSTYEVPPTGTWQHCMLGKRGHIQPPKAAPTWVMVFLSPRQKAMPVGPKRTPCCD